MKHDCILFIGTGQIGRAILNKIVQSGPKKIVVHNLTENESALLCKKYSSIYPKIKFISSYGNIFMPYDLKDLNNKNLYDESKNIINYFYSEINQSILERSTIATLIKKYKPSLIVDAINTATVLGNAYNPENSLKCYKENPLDCAEKIMVDDYTTKLINFIYSLKYGIETYGVKKYIKVSTTGLGGMGINMPYTHGDNPKMNLSSALMGKISASGVLHQLLWNLAHTMGNNISLIIPGTFVGYDSVKNEPIETDKGLLFRRILPKSYNLLKQKKIKYNEAVTEDYLEFPVVRAGENHVYSKLELNVLTAIGQMEGITKEEVANKVVDCINGKSSHDILVALDNAMLNPTYLGREMIYDISRNFDKCKCKLGIATGNLGVTLSKKLYELYLIKMAYSTIDDLKKAKIDKIVEKTNQQLNKAIIEESISLGIPILDYNYNFYVGDYSLYPSVNDESTVNEKNINKWAKIGWVDLRKENIKFLVDMLVRVYEDALEKSKICDNDIYFNFKKIENEYDIAEYLAYYNNLEKKGRIK